MDMTVRVENNKNLYRYNITGFVEELPQLPDIRRGHACGAFPTNGVRSKESKHLKGQLGPPSVTKNVCLSQKMITFNNRSVTKDV